MSYRFLIRPEAEADLAEAKRWYERQREGLGADFLLCVEEALEKTRRHPELYPVVYQDIRRAVLRRFPYAIFYRLVGQQIVVIGVLHGRRDPSEWQSRA
jgi:plasmid stabilization system protein ParE